MTFDEKRAFFTFRAAHHAQVQDIRRLEEVANILIEAVEGLLEHPPTEEQKAAILNGIAEIRQIEKTEWMPSFLPEAERPKLVPRPKIG